MTFTKTHGSGSLLERAMNLEVASEEAAQEALALGSTNLVSPTCTLGHIYFTYVLSSHPSHALQYDK